MPGRATSTNLAWFKRSKQWPFFLVALLLGAALLWALRAPVVSLLSFVSDRDAFTVYIHGFGWLGPVILSLLHLLQILISILPGDVFYFAAGYVYGLVPGFTLNLVVTVGSGLLAFFIARRWGRPVVDRLAPSSVIDRWDAAARRHGFVFFVMSFMLPVFPTDTMNYVAGLSLIPWQQFALASLLGRAPMILLFTLLGAHGMDIVALKLDPLIWLLVVLVVVAMYLVWIFFFRKLTTEVLSKAGA